MAIDYNTLLTIAALYGAQKYGGGGSGDTPNTYPIPLTPEQKRVDDEKWRVYQGGGSDVQKAVRAGAAQFFSGQPTAPTNFKFMSDELKDQPFAGGVTMPKIDFTALLSSIKPRGDAPPPTLTKKPGANLDLTKREIGDGLAPSIPGRDLGGMVDAPPPGITDTDIGALKSAWDAFRAQHPNWAKLGVETARAALSAIGGPAGAAAGWFLKKWLMTDPESPLKGINGGIGGAGLTPDGSSDSGLLTGSISGLQPEDRGAVPPPKNDPRDQFFPIVPIEEQIRRDREKRQPPLADRRNPEIVADFFKLLQTAGNPRTLQEWQPWYLRPAT